MQKRLPRYSEDFQNKILKYPKWESQQLSLVGRLLLFKGIRFFFGNDCNDSQINFTEYNKPFFNSGHVKFNISHAGEIVVCALTKIGEIGIDIELMQDKKIDDFRVFMTDNEWIKIKEARNSTLEFYNYWTEKESIIKIYGHGMTLPLQSFEIQEKQTQINEQKYYLKEIKIHPDYLCHMAFGENLDDHRIKIKNYSIEEL